MADVRLGERITGATPQRDAIHVPVIAVIVGEDGLKAGDPVNVCDEVAKKCSPQFTSGIIDPFLQVTLKRGDIVWLLVRPGAVKQLTHMWDHPDFPNTSTNIDYDDGCAGCYND